MHLEYYKTFITLSETRNFSTTAKILNMVQSTVSNRVKELEQHYGCQLFDRTNKSVTLTPKGKKLLPFIEDIVKTESDAKKEISRTQYIHQIRIGTVHAYLHSQLKRTLKSLLDNHNNIGVNIIINHSNYLIEQLLKDEIDIAFVSYAPKSIRYDIHHLFEDEIVLAGVDNLFLSKEELLNIHLVHADFGLEFEQYILNELGIQLDPFIYFDQIHESLEWIKNTSGIGFTLKSLLNGQPELKEMILENYQPFKLNMYMIVSKRLSESPLYKEFTRISLKL